MSNPLTTYLTPISAESPSGADLEYDPQFSNMEKASQGTPDQEFGSTRIEGEPADWEAVRDAAIGLLSRTHDLRVAVYLTQAELILNGLVGLRNGLELIAGYTETFWETVFPLLDEDDDNDPTMRLNALISLNRAGNVLLYLKQTPIVKTRGAKLRWLDVLIARGDIPAPSDMDSPPTQRMVDATVAATSLEELQELFGAVEESIRFVERIEQSFVDRLGYSASPNLADLTKDLKSIHKLQKGWLETKRPHESESTEGTEEEQAGEDRGLISVQPSNLQGVSQAKVYGAASFNIGRREDAVEGLDNIIDWFERFEPSSPLPMLLRRAKRLSGMSFMEILEDLSPGGLEQAIVIAGKDASDNTSVSPQRRDDGY